MNVVDRILLTFMALISMVVSAFVFTYATGVIGLEFLGTSLSLYYGKWEIGVAAAVVLLVNARFLVLALKTEKIQEVTVSGGKLGKVAVSFGAVESLVQKVIRDNGNVKEAKVFLKSREGGLCITIKLSIEEDIVIPEIAQELQSSIKEYVETTAGTLVKEIFVSVDKITSQSTLITSR